MPDDGFDPSVPWGNPVSYIAEAQGLGWTQSETLRTFRADGAEMATQTFGRLWHEIADSSARQSDAASLDPMALPGPNDYATWTMGKGGEYATSVNVLFRDVDTGLIGTKQFLYKTADPHTPAEAQQAAWDEFSDPDNEQLYGQVALGVSTRNVFQTQAFRP